jgi:hypothetical protein
MALSIKTAKGLGVLEFWSIGVLEKAKLEVISLNKSLHYSTTPLLHHSITPADSPMRERPCKPPVGVAQSPSGNSLLHH